MSENEVKVKVKYPSDEAIVLDPRLIKQAKDWEEIVSLWTISKEIDIKNQWIKGDIINRAIAVHGEGCLKKFAEQVNESIRTIENYRRVARAFPASMRNLNISWTHYLISSYSDSYNRKLKKFVTRNRFDWLRKAHDNSWSCPRLTQEIKKSGAIVDRGDVFNYYEAYIKKVRHVLLHIEKDKLKPVEKKRLIGILLHVYNEFMVYLAS